jgi:hypothetical protein
MTASAVAKGYGGTSSRKAYGYVVSGVSVCGKMFPLSFLFFEE